MGNGDIRASAQRVVELAGLFRVSTDDLLGVDSIVTADVSDLTEEDVRMVCAMIGHLRRKN